MALAVAVVLAELVELVLRLLAVLAEQALIYQHSSVGLHILWLLAVEAQDIAEVVALAVHQLEAMAVQTQWVVLPLQVGLAVAVGVLVLHTILVATALVESSTFVVESQVLL